MRRPREGIFGAVVKATVLEASVGKSGTTRSSRALYYGTYKIVRLLQVQYPDTCSHIVLLQYKLQVVWLQPAASGFTNVPMLDDFTAAVVCVLCLSCMYGCVASTESKPSLSTAYIERPAFESLVRVLYIYRVLSRCSCCRRLDDLPAAIAQADCWQAGARANALVLGLWQGAPRG